eukprot:gnl/TRDRNA2_/TRDRNA2_173646_c3_seq1.p2 gnl/TRDRNA2_/TRDRNA2_173646_c3~~gnl/TRDRNA2_/TRDRNA2_173646_c3_seq1.p2  ORF type:complete len:101 (-),score=2.94 gnl/TRDRNA2_/TRDRNA2_173646_c3_seq1:255-557(-)
MQQLRRTSLSRREECYTNNLDTTTPAHSPFKARKSAMRITHRDPKEIPVSSQRLILDCKNSFRRRRKLNNMAVYGHAESAWHDGSTCEQWQNRSTLQNRR